MGGMLAWLAGEGRRFDPSSTLVLGLDTLGAGEPTAVSAEAGPLRLRRYRARDLEWADRGAERAGLPRPPRFGLGAWTDPIVAVFAGLPAVSLVSLRDGGFTNYHLPTDTPERVDWTSVERSAGLGLGIAEAFAGR